MAPGHLERRTLGFWGMVGVVMTALKLKETWDDYRRLPSEEDGLGSGPVALHSPLGGEAPPLPEILVLDTEIPGAVRPKRKRRGCCVCCGINCGLFWKAFGIVFLLFVVWQSMKLVFWAVKPTPTGLENMPEFSTSLGCDDAPYIYNPDHTIYSIPFSAANAAHALELQGGAVGTVLVKDATEDTTEIQYEVIVRTNDVKLLKSVTFEYPTRDEVDEGVANSRARLTAPSRGVTSCIRYDVVVHVPPRLTSLDIQAHSVAQIQFAPASEVKLNSLTVRLHTDSNNNMLLPKAGIHAKEVSLTMLKGWLVGEVSIVDKATLTTKLGDAVSNVRFFPAPVSAEDGSEPSKVQLFTETGAGRSDFFYISDASTPHRPIDASHRAWRREGDMYLQYNEAEFNGQVDLQAKSWSATGLQGTFNRTAGGQLPWVGNADGGDKLVAFSKNGWIGLYF